MKRCAVIVCCVFAVGSCTSDRVRLERGPLGPASYEVRVRAQGDESAAAEEHNATLTVRPRSSGASFALRTTQGDTVTAEVAIMPNGSVDLTRVRGTPVPASGQTELASLVGQLNPPLPNGRVRLGDRWSSTQRITTKALSASLRTSLRMVRFRRIASTDAAELLGDVTGDLRVFGGAWPLSGTLSGRTQIVWAVRAGRVVAADTNLVWTLSDGSRVNLETSVRPR
jgi:hypothetical protein